MFGIEIPKIKIFSKNNNNLNLTVELLDNDIMFINDTYNNFYYVFDIYKSRTYYKYESSLNYFIFSNLFGIIIGYLINKLFDN